MIASRTSSGMATRARWMSASHRLVAMGPCVSVTPMGTTGRSGTTCTGKADSDSQVGRGRGEIQAGAVEHDVGYQAELLGWAGVRDQVGVGRRRRFWP